MPLARVSKVLRNPDARLGFALAPPGATLAAIHALALLVLFDTVGLLSGALRGGGGGGGGIGHAGHLGGYLAGLAFHHRDRARALLSRCRRGGRRTRRGAAAGGRGRARLLAVHGGQSRGAGRSEPRTRATPAPP